MGHPVEVHHDDVHARIGVAVSEEPDGFVDARQGRDQAHVIGALELLERAGVPLVANHEHADGRRPLHRIRGTIGDVDGEPERRAPRDRLRGGGP